MRFRPEHYIDNCTESIEAARRLHEEATFAKAIYLAGVAVECLLRAYRTRQDPEFDSRHDLLDLVKASGIAEFVPEAYQIEFAAHMGNIWSRWKNDYRYASEERLRAEFKNLKYDRYVKGDILKQNSKIVLESALFIINIGVVKWKMNSGK